MCAFLEKVENSTAYLSSANDVGCENGGVIMVSLLGNNVKHK